MLLNYYKINLTLRLCKYLKYQLSFSQNDEIISKIHNILNLLINILNNCLNKDTFDRKSNIKIAVAKRLCLIVKQIYRQTVLYSEWKVYNDLCQRHPDVFDALMNRNIDAQTAYKWSQESYNNCYHVFENKLTNLLNADEFQNIQSNNSTIVAQDLFVKTLVKILAQYKTYTILINSLNEIIKQQEKQMNNILAEMQDNKQTLDSMALKGQIIELRELNKLPPGRIPARRGQSIKTISTDGDGAGCQIMINNGKIIITNGGNNYKMNDVIYIKHIRKTYFFRVIDITQRHVFATQIKLDDIQMCIPPWIKIYKMLYPGKFDFCILLKLKEEIEKYGIQYVLLKHQCISDSYDKAMSKTFAVQ